MATRRGFADRLRAFMEDEGVDQDRIDAVQERFFTDRRPAVLTLAELEGLGRLQCTNAELGAYFGLTERQIIKRRAADSELDEAIKRGANQGKISIRRKQYEAALAGDRTMLVWLGKNVLGQRDSGLDINVSGGLSFDSEEIRPLLDQKLEDFVRARRGNGHDDDPPDYH